MATKAAGERKARKRMDPKNLKKNQPSGPMLAILNILQVGSHRIRFYPGQRAESDVKCPIIEPVPMEGRDILAGYDIQTTRFQTLAAMVKRGMLKRRTVDLTPHLTCQQWELPA